MSVEVRDLSLLTSFIGDTRWMMSESHVESYLLMYQHRLSHKLSVGSEEYENVFKAAASKKYGMASTGQEQVQPGVALIGIHGPISSRLSMMSMASGASSAHTLASQIEAAANDPLISHIVLDIDSPGGATHGLDVAADAIFNARQVKPVIAIANSLMASAGYLLGSQASKLYVTSAGEVGSIGVIATIPDYTKRNESEGVSFTIERSANKKAPINPNESLTSERLAMIREDLQVWHEIFVSYVARGRGVSIEEASLWATGETWYGASAQEVGLVDEVSSLSAVLSSLSSPPPVARSSGYPRRVSVDPTVSAVKLEAPDVAEALISEGRSLALSEIFKEAGVSSTSELSQVVKDAADYRADLIQQLREGIIRTGGTSSESDRMASIFQGATLSSLKEQVSELKTKAERIIPGARLSQDGPETTPEETGRPRRVQFTDV